MFRDGLRDVRAWVKRTRPEPGPSVPKTKVYETPCREWGVVSEGDAIIGAMRAPTWYHDGQLSLDRQRMKQAHAVVTRVEDEIPPGGSATDRLQSARADAYLAERLFAERFMELASTDGAGAGGHFKPGDHVLDAAGNLWVRASEDDAAKGWAWGYPAESVGIAEGAVREGHPARPLVLLIRDGKPVGGVRVVE